MLDSDQLEAGHGLDLSAEDLTHLDLRRVDLVGVDLAGKNLSGVDFAGADLRRAQLGRSNLAGCSFRGATLDAANLVGADLTASDFTECTAKRAIFGETKMQGIVFFAADLSQATLSGADATGGDFRAAELSGVRFLGADLTDCDLSRATLREADLTGATVANAIFTESDLSSSSLRGVRQYDSADWVNVSIRDIEFSGAYLVRRAIMDQNYLHEFRNSDRNHEILYQIWKATSDCGRSFVRWGFLTAVVAMVFGILYTQVALDYGSNQTVLSPLYFSIVTLTTLGYGDVLPASLAAQILVLIEVVVGYVMLGGVLSIFATRMGRRAD